SGQAGFEFGLILGVLLGHAAGQTPPAFVLVDVVGREASQAAATIGKVSGDIVRGWREQAAGHCRPSAAASAFSTSSWRQRSAPVLDAESLSGRGRMPRSTRRSIVEIL